MIRILVLVYILPLITVTTDFLYIVKPDTMTLFNVITNESQAGKTTGGVFTFFFTEKLVLASFWSSFLYK